MTEVADAQLKLQQRLIVVGLLGARKLRFGPYYDTAKEVILTGEFHGVQVMNGSKPTLPEILPAQFYQSLADHMRTRLLTSASRITTVKAASEDASIYTQ